MELPLGVIVGLREEPEESVRKVHDLGLPTCQISCWRVELLNEEVAGRLGEAAERYGVKITTIWTGYPGPAVWNL
ncbi:MAG TPA: sugar phosphate isomerase/epimerase, partial [Firmicutes bacterium]|nr:sugar phosphate isomerase/epimerase [Bacillota bacterium]